MVYAFLGIAIGIILGFFTNNMFQISPQYSIYLLLVILAVTNSSFTIISKKNMAEFKIKYCFMYIFIDIIVALVLGFISDKLGLPLYLALVFAFGNNIYKNIQFIINS